MSALDLDALVMAVLSAANNGWRLDDVPDGGVGVSFMLGMARFVLTVMPNGAARLVDGQGIARPDDLARLIDWLRGRGFSVRDADQPAGAPRQVNTFIRPDGPPNRPSPPPRAWRRP